MQKGILPRISTIWLRRAQRFSETFQPQITLIMQIISVFNQGNLCVLTITTVYFFHSTSHFTACLWSFMPSAFLADTYSFEFTETLLRIYWHFPSIVLKLSFDFAKAFLWFHWFFPLISLKCRAFNVNTANLRHRNAEGSPSRWRTFGN